MTSLKQHHPELPTHVVSLPDNSTLLDKARMFEVTPFEETLYLDIDTVVLGKLNFVFEKANTFGLACSICECPWGRRYGGLSGDTIEYNTGALFFTRKAKPIFDAWARNATTLDSSIQHIGNDGRLLHTPYNDQGGFAKAVEDAGVSPFVLPLNWNFRPQYYMSLLWAYKDLAFI